MFDKFRRVRFEDIRYKPTPNNKSSGGGIIGGTPFIVRGKDYLQIYISTDT